MKKLFQSKNIVRLLYFAGAVFVVFYFLPHTDTTLQKFEIDRPWSYGLLTAPIDIPVPADDNRMQELKDSIDTYSPPVMQINKTASTDAVSALTTNLSKDDGAVAISFAERRNMVTALQSIYALNIVDNSIIDRAKAGKLHTVQIAENENEYRIVNVDELISAKDAYNKLEELLPSERYRIISNYVDISRYIKPNLAIDSLRTDAFRENELKRLTPPMSYKQKGEKIIDRGEIVTAETYRILQAYANKMDNKGNTNGERLYVWAGQLAVILIMYLGLYAFLMMFRWKIFGDMRRLGFLMMLSVGMLIIAFMVQVHFTRYIYAIPFTIIPIIVMTFMDSRTAFNVHLLIVLLFSFTVVEPLEFIFLQMAAGLMAICSLKDLSKRSQLIRTAILLFVTYAVTYAAYIIFSDGTIQKVEIRMFGYLAVNCGTILFAYLLIYMFERTFGFISTVTLVELSDVNSPLLRQLSEECPGTFNHSLQVSNLAAEAAHRIGANVQLVRTGALYHDIGKMKNPVFFTENQSGVNPHSPLPYDKSAAIVIKHVTDGLAMAKKARLPQAVTDFIITHHGKGKTKFFYNSYRNKFPNGNISDEAFTYPGPNPSTKETSILMMADSVEAASRSLNEYTNESISELVNKIINGQINDGLMADTPLSFRDISIIKKSFIDKLRTMHHTRISYPELQNAAGSAENDTVDIPEAENGSATNDNAIK